MTVATEKQLDLLPVNQAFSRVVGPESINRAAEALRRRGFAAHIVDTADDARDLVMSLIPEGSEVGQGASQTLEEIGVTAALEDERYVPIRSRTRTMDRATQSDEIRKLSASPDVQVNSIQALTEDGEIVIGSFSGSQLGPIASGAGKVILVVGAQKIVADLAAGFQRLHEYSLPLEDAKMQRQFGGRSHLNKTLLISGDVPAGRITVVLVRQPVGV